MGFRTHSSWETAIYTHLLHIEFGVPLLIEDGLVIDQGYWMRVCLIDSILGVLGLGFLGVGIWSGIGWCLGLLGWFEWVLGIVMVEGGG